MKQLKKPPLGIVPKELYYRNTKLERFLELKRAISGYLKEDLAIDIAWVEEYNELLKEEIEK